MVGTGSVRANESQFHQEPSKVLGSIKPGTVGGLAHHNTLIGTCCIPLLQSKDVIPCYCDFISHSKKVLGHTLYMYIELS